MTGSVTFDVAIGGDGSTVTDDNNATTGLRDGGWRTRFVPCFTNQVSIANYVVTQANAASASATAAGSSATSAAATYDSFDDRYLGSKTSDPSVDNDGNALLTGALYWNSTSSVMKVYSGSAWVSAYVPSSGYLALTGGTMTGAITFASAQFGTNVNTFLTTPTSANLAAALTDETGTGVNVFNNTPTLITPILGTPQSGNLANCTFPTLNQNTTGTAATATNLASGSVGTIPYQSASGTTAMLAAGTSGNVLTCNGAAAPSWQPAGASLTGFTGATNTALGVSALTALTTGTNNTATGTYALNNNTSGFQNSALGKDALRYNTTGTENSAFGYQALYSNETGENNLAAGTQALNRNTTGNANVGVGSFSLYLNTTGSRNAAVGVQALYSNTTGYENLATGYQALYSNTTGYNNSAFGRQALYSNTTGDTNLASGNYALFSNSTGYYNSAFGKDALRYNTTGNFNLALGSTALYYNSTGEGNTALGYGAFLAKTTGNYNVGIGYDCAASSTTVSNEVNIYNGTVTARFQGSASSWSFVSDIRDKTNIVDLELGLNFINKLQPRKFEWNLRHTDVDKGKVASGFIAQEVLSVLEQEDALFTGLVDTNDSEKYMLAQTNLIPILVNAIKELSAELAALKLKVGN